MKADYDFGIIGLGTMGLNLALNMSDKGYSVAGFDKNESQSEAFNEKGNKGNISSFTKLQEFISALKSPRSVILLVPAGAVVDNVINELKPLLQNGDLLMDFGNSNFKDTERREKELNEEKIHFMGIGISGGEEGARNGPSMMCGGSNDDYKRVSEMLEAIAAKVNDDPCVAHLGPAGAGHYVKMVHNGIEYCIMQLIAESYHLLKIAGKNDNNALHKIFKKWNEGPLHSFLVSITADIFLQEDDLTKNRLIDMIKDAAAQKGTGAWASEDAFNLQVPVPLMDMAVSMRGLSAEIKEREKLNKYLKGPELDHKRLATDFTDDLEKALYFGMIVAFTQGMSLLRAASEKYSYHLKLNQIAKIWRGGCIIRASVLGDIMDCYDKDPEAASLLENEKFSGELNKSQKSIRTIIKTAVEYGIPVPGLMSSLSYYDEFRSKWLPANLIQAQRDCFGAHTYRRYDREGSFHTSWKIKES